MFIETIKRLKKEKGLTNAQLAELSGLTLSTLDKITSGINKNPKLETMRAIASALECTLDDFLGEPGQVEAESTLSSDTIKMAKSFERAPSNVRRAVLAMLEPYMEETAAEIFPATSGKYSEVERRQLHTMLDKQFDDEKKAEEISEASYSAELETA